MRSHGDNPSGMDYKKVEMRTVGIRFNGTIHDDPRQIILDTFAQYISVDFWEWLIRKEKYNIWYLTVQTEQQADLLAGLEDVKVSDNLSIGTFSCGREKLSLRIHWLPASVDDDAICNFFAYFGKIVNIKDEHCSLPRLLTVKSGVRLVTMEVNSRDKDTIPHRCSIGGCSALVTFRGRPPLCLKCGETGHVRKACPYRQSSQSQSSPPPTAAQRAMDDAVQRQRGMTTDSTSDLDIDEIQRELIGTDKSDLYGDPESQTVVVTEKYAQPLPDTPNKNTHAINYADAVRRNTEEPEIHVAKKQRVSRNTRSSRSSSRNRTISPTPTPTANRYDVLAGHSSMMDDPLIDLEHHDMEQGSSLSPT